MKMKLSTVVLLALAAGAPLIGCAASAPDPLAEAAAETGLDTATEQMPAGTKFDLDGDGGPRIAAGASTEVWAVTNQWADTDTTAARAEGLAWGPNSGLDWEQKYDRWIASFQTVANRTRSGLTFSIPTPFGDRELESPTLECAEVALLLRGTFSSWYHLPFFIQGWDAAGRQTLYAGHFGFVNTRGERVGNFPNFRTSYRDYTSEWSPGGAWPHDSRLRTYHLGDDDRVPFLGSGEGAGAYFDELFLNKRAGYFMRLLMLYFGSTNLADGANMFHVRPTSLNAGDVLLERWQRQGIGHTIPVIRVNEPIPGRFEATVATGSMPRRQPVWEEPASARHTFTLDATGGEGESWDGDVYAKLGGGLRRWRTAELRSGRWINNVRTADRDAYIDDGDYATIASRPAEFGTILADVSPAEQIAVAQAEVTDARAHLLDYPASCAARTRREDALERMVELVVELRGVSREQAEADNRTLADYVFGELEYRQSKTCCWNHSNAVMAEIVMDYADQEQADATAAGMCAAPTIFRAEAGAGDGYDRWRSYAESLGRGAEWRAWSEDEPCAQRDVAEDLPTARPATGFCALPGGATGTEPPPPTDTSVTPAPADACDPTPADSQHAAVSLTSDLDARICDADEDWYKVEGPATVVVSFTHANGDLDVEAFDPDGGRIDDSNSVSDEERVTGSGIFFVRVYGYSGATNSYHISIAP